MISTLLNGYRRESAERECDLAYMIEEMDDMAIDEALEILEDGEIKESTVGYDQPDPEIQEMMERMDEIPDGHEDELRRIMETTEGITFDQMIGIEPIMETSEDE